MSRYAQPTNVQDAVRMADRLSDILGRLGVPLTQARALDLLARLCGQPDWGRMRDGLVRLEAAQVPIADHAISLILRLNERDPVLTARAVEAVWGAHLTATERADPGLAAARDWLRAATLAAHAWAAAERAPLTPDILLCALVAGEAGAPLPTGRVRPQGALMPRPALLDLRVWADRDRISAPWVSGLDAVLRATPGFDPDGLMRGEPQPARFRTAAQTRTRLTLRPLRELIDEVRMEPDTGDG